MPESAIELKSVSKRFGDTEAVSDLNLKVERGSIFGFLGSNGAGKTTTIKIILGIRKPSQGDVYVLGDKVNGRNPALLARVGYVPESESIYGNFTPLQTINSVKPYYPKWDSGLEKSYLDRFELPPNKKVAEFSLGMKRKLQLLLALSSRPELLVMDEPTLGLDPITRYKFLQTLVQEVTQGGMTVFLSSHNLSEVERICDTVAFIKKGKLLELKKLDDLKKEGQRIKVVFQKDIPPAALNIPGVEILDGSGKHYVLSLSGDITNALEEINKLPTFIIEDQDTSLEDIFVEKMEGN